jgi:hypothetical protein
MTHEIWVSITSMRVTGCGKHAGSRSAAIIGADPGSTIGATIILMPFREGAVVVPVQQVQTQNPLTWINPRVIP